jgi:hypothetical protein
VGYFGISAILADLCYWYEMCDELKKSRSLMAKPKENRIFIVFNSAN